MPDNSHQKSEAVSHPQNKQAVVIQHSPTDMPTHGSGVGSHPDYTMRNVTVDPSGRPGGKTHDQPMHWIQSKKDSAKGGYFPYSGKSLGAGSGENTEMNK